MITKNIRDYKDYKINANLIELHVGGFETNKDKEAFDLFCDCLYSMTNGIVITPIYDDKNSELMSFIVDSKKAATILAETEK